MGQDPANRANELSLSGILSRGDHDVKRQVLDQARIGLAQAKDNLELLQKGRIQGGGIGFDIPVPDTEMARRLDKVVAHAHPGVWVLVAGAARGDLRDEASAWLIWCGIGSVCGS